MQKRRAAEKWVMRDDDPDSRIALTRGRGEHGRLDRERHSRPNLSDHRSAITERRSPNADHRTPFVSKKTS
jgi:hypothetical protein